MGIWVWQIKFIQIDSISFPLFQFCLTCVTQNKKVQFMNILPEYQYNVPPHFTCTNYKVWWGGPHWIWIHWDRYLWTCQVMVLSWSFNSSYWISFVKILVVLFQNIHRNCHCLSIKQHVLLHVLINSGTLVMDFCIWNCSWRHF